MPSASEAVTKRRNRITAFIREAESWLIRETLAATGNSVTETARTLGIARADLYKRLYRSGIRTKREQRRLEARTAANMSPEFRRFLQVFGVRKEEGSNLRPQP